jgi:plastocyanin
MRRLAALAAALALPGCGSSSISLPPPAASPSAPPPTEVTIRASGFDPAVLHVFEGRAMTFVNADGVPHAVFADKHPAHDTCGGRLNVTVAPGERRRVEDLPIDACYFHDEADPAAPAFQGVLVVH